MNRDLAVDESSLPKSFNRRQAGSVPPTAPARQLEKDEEHMSTLYRDLLYPTLPETKGSFADRLKLDITSESNSPYRPMLEEPSHTPRDILYHKDISKVIHQKLADMNEFRVMRGITPTEMLCS